MDSETNNGAQRDENSISINSHNECSTEVDADSESIISSMDDTSTKNSNQQVWICPHHLCRKRFSRKSHYNRHLQTHSGEKPFCCQICGKRYARREHLTRHENSHTKQISFICKFESCGKLFYNATHLRRHESTHKKVYQCELCNKGFSKHYLYLRHKRNHQFDSARTSDHKYSCIHKSCNSIYSTLAGLKKHVKLHDRIYPCEDCPNQFSKYSELLTHKKEAHPKSFPCDICQKTYNRRSRMINHQRKSHQDDERVNKLLFICPVKDCGKTFSRRSNMTAHFQAEHRESMIDHQSDNSHVNNRDKLVDINNSCNSCNSNSLESKPMIKEETS